MTQAVLIGLAVLWTVVLVPGWVQSVRERSGRKTTIDSFSQQLSAMQGMGYEAPAGRPPGSRLNPALQFSGHRRPRSSVPQSAKDASQRRRDILGLLVLCLMATLAGWFVSHQTAVLITHLVFDVALVGFVLLVLQRRQLEAERMAKVHYLHAAADSEIAGIARRSAN
ncbi:MAG: hypothetical protein ACKVHU_16045 [Acidimicrobiales bacterium]|jgi:Flp pilus assembly protein TadB